MSHVARMKFILDDLDAVEQACRELGLVLMRGQKSYTWFGRYVGDYTAPQSAVVQGVDPTLLGRCDHAIRRANHKPGDYEIGLAKVKNGTGYSVLYDNFDTGQWFSAKMGGVDLPELYDEYNYAKSKRELHAAGYMATRRYTKEGRLQISAVKY